MLVVLESKVLFSAVGIQSVILDDSDNTGTGTRGAISETEILRYQHRAFVTFINRNTNFFKHPYFIVSSFYSTKLIDCRNLL